ncbi:topoisomerase I binding, arginine/serine-rich a [Brachionichthys hirsutus]|uniref:topoisomerase I binding, arginine/serine-rich a n=1 Tax=Brachionichthys hirsutus TaxID=412623 RepID=UPI00360503CB
MSAIKVAPQRSQKGGESKASKAMSAEASPDSKCPICLDMFNNISYLDICLHKFCFRCIHEWSKNKAECPLCKKPFSSIYHSIKSEHDFKKYDLQPLDNGSFGTFGGVRFRYRTTLTGFHRQVRRRTSSPPDNGVLFEASANVPQPPRDRYVRRMAVRLEAKRRAASEGRPVGSVGEQEMINFRRELYRRGVRVRIVRDGGRSRDTSAEFFRRNSACLHRLVPWLKRELAVLYGAHGSLVNIVQHIIMSRITRYDMEDGAIGDELKPFLQGRTEHFLHEFISFAKSPFNMEAYDQHAVYDCPAPSSNENSSSDSSVIAISEDEELAMDADASGNSASTLSRSAWDDETPGPSYSTTAEPGGAGCPSVLDLDSDSSLEEELVASPQREGSLPQTGAAHKAECLSSDSDDCVIVDVVKARAQRTPELVKLSSDSEEAASERAKGTPLLRQHIHFHSVSPIASQSSDASVAGRSDKSETECKHVLDSKVRNDSPTSSKHKVDGRDTDGRGTDGRGTDRRGTDGRDTDGGFDSNGGSQERNYSKVRGHRRRRRSRSDERRYYGEGGAVSHSGVHIVPRGRGDCHSKRDGNYDNRDGGNSYHSYRRHNQERLERRTRYADEQPRYNRRRRRSGRHSDSLSRSRSSESRRRERKHSRSRTFSSSRSPSIKMRFHHDKPGGKRKYKTKHLEEPPEEALPNSPAEGDCPTARTKHTKPSEDGRRTEPKERSRRSLSVELYNDGNSDRAKRHHKKKKKHKKKSRRHRSNERREKGSPHFITIDSDSDSFAHGRITRENATDDLDPGPPAPPSNE